MEVESSSERQPFTRERIANVTALHELERATGFSKAYLEEKIPELRNDALAFRIEWASDQYGETDVGRSNAAAVRDFVVVEISTGTFCEKSPTLTTDVCSVPRSYHINSASAEIKAFAGHYDATDDLLIRYATVREPSETEVEDDQDR